MPRTSPTSSSSLSSLDPRTLESRVSISRGRILLAIAHRAEGDTLFMFNYRSDRMREITAVFGLPDKPMEVNIPEDLHITTMSKYNPEWTFPVAFPPASMDNVLAE